MQTSSLSNHNFHRVKSYTFQPPFFSSLFSSLFLSPAQTLVAKVKDNQGSLDGDITEDADANAVVALETTKAGVARDGGKVDQATRDGDLGAANSKGE